MPRLGLSMVEGTVTEWRARRGDAVTRGQILLVVESEKAEVEVEAFAAGVLRAVYVEVGNTVPVGTLLGAVTEPGEEFDAEKFAARFVPETSGAPATAARITQPRPPAAGFSPESQPDVVMKVAPAARALARKLGIDLTTIAGSGPGGRILPEDVERAARSRIALGDGWLSAEVHGQGPSLLMICGFGVDATSWRRQVEDLSSDHAVITYDHRGIASSAPLGKGDVTIGDLAEDSHALLVARGKTPAVVVGASLGAAVALELALAHADAVRGLVLITPLLSRDPRFESVLRSWSETDSPAAEARIRAMLPWFLGRTFLGQPGKREAATAALRAMAGRTPAETLRRHAAALLGWLGTRAGDLSRITSPTLIVAGGEDLLAPPEQAAALARALFKAEVEVLAGAGHALAIERAAELNALIRNFAARV